jgi:predicted ATPase/DNA-binding CsgD family transcriptional regulator/transcriptional regulator with XRE-family HTH domain
MTTALTFGGWLKRRRMGLGLTQKELAHQVGYAAVTLRKVEADELRPSWQMAQKLAEALELAPDEQAQFVRFARDEAQWDDIALPAGVKPPMHPAQPPEATPTLNSSQDQAGMTIISRQILPLQFPSTFSDEAATRGEFARPRPKHNLPALTTPLIGREPELAELAYLLADPAVRLVTILAAGGMGKTHLAIAAALQQVGHFSHGVCWVPLAPLTDAKELVLAIAAALGLQLQGERTPEQQVGDYLHAKRLLLVLDNFEHLLAGAPLAGALLAAAPQLSILATSRQRLKLSSETVLLLEGLPFPADQPADQSAHLLDYPAVALFLLHARRVRAHYEPDERDVAGIVDICRLVDGMPLGILLAAAWSGVISPPQIAAEIGSDLGFLQTDMPDVPARQRNLRVVFLHTWSRLSAAERDAFMRLSVFRGGATPEAAQRVTGATVAILAGLIDKALLWRLPSGRYAVHELLRQFAAEQLAAADTAQAGAQQEAQRQHSRCYLNLLGEQEQPLQGQEQRAALDAVRADFENISVAWRWAVQHEVALVAPAIHSLFLYCEIRGSYRDGLMLFKVAAVELASDAAANAAEQTTVQPLWGKVLVRLGYCTFMLGDCEGGEQHMRAGLQLVSEDRERARALLYLAHAAGERGDTSRTRVLSLASLEISRKGNDTAGIADALHRLTFAQSDYADNCRLCSESLALWRKLGRQDRVATLLNDLAMNSWFGGDYAQAEACWRESVPLCDELDMRNEKAWALDSIGLAVFYQGDIESADRCFQDALAIFTELGRQVSMGMCVAEVALVLAATDRAERAVALARQAVAVTRHKDSQQMLAYSLNCLGAVLIAAGAPVEARSTLREALQCAWQGGYTGFVMIAFCYFAELLTRERRDAAPRDELEGISLAVALLNCVRTDAATWQVFKDKAATLLAEIAGALPPATPTAAMRSGESRTVAELVGMVLGEEPTVASARPTSALASRPEDPARRRQVAATLVEPLSARELEILRLLAQGYTNQQIADRLHVVVGTVKAHNHHIFGKLGVTNRVQALARARELALI